MFAVSEADARAAVRALPLALVSPEHLSANSREFFNVNVVTGTFDDPPGRVLLLAFCEMLDALAEARSHLKTEGAVFLDRWHQPRANPWARRELELVRELGKVYRL